MNEYDVRATVLPPSKHFSLQPRFCASALFLKEGTQSFFQSSIHITNQFRHRTVVGSSILACGIDEFDESVVPK